MNVNDAFTEFRLGLDYVNTGLFVSITPDGIIDLRPSDRQIEGTVCSLWDELNFNLFGADEPDYPECIMPQSVEDVLHNVLLHCWYCLRRAIECRTRERLNLMLRTCDECAKWINSIYPER